MNLVGPVVSAFIIRPVKPGEELGSRWVLRWASVPQLQRVSDTGACGGFGPAVEAGPPWDGKVLVGLWRL